MSLVTKIKTNIKNYFVLKQNFGFFRANKVLIKKLLMGGKDGETTELIKITNDIFKDILSKYINVSTFENEKYNFPNRIFVFWWDGFSAAPRIVQDCLKSIHKFNKFFEVIELDKHNLNNYIDKKNKIYLRFIQGKISVQNFSDYLRMYLIYNFGGFWIDSTYLFLADFDLKKLLKNRNFSSIYTEKSSVFFGKKNPTCWNGNFIGGLKGNALSHAFIDCFEYYYDNFKSTYTYFMIDFIIYSCFYFGVDNNVLKKTEFIDGDIFYISQTGYKNINEYKKIKVPQKLSYRDKISEEFYNFIEDILF